MMDCKECNGSDSAAGPWEIGEPPKDGSKILAVWPHGIIAVTYWLPIFGNWLAPFGNGCLKEDPLKFARINQ